MAETIATVDDLVARLARMFARYQEEILAFAPAYKHALGHLGPASLTAAFWGVLDDWDKAGFPKPGEFAKRTVGPKKQAVERQEWWGGAAAAQQIHQHKRDMVSEAMRRADEDMASQAAGHEGEGYADELRSSMQFELERMADVRLFGTVADAPTDDHGALDLPWRLAHERAASRIRLRPKADGWTPAGHAMRQAAERLTRPRRSVVRERPSVLDEQPQADLDRAALV